MTNSSQRREQIANNRICAYSTGDDDTPRIR